MQITRKEFLGRLLGSAAGLVGAAMVVGCSSSSDSSSGTPDAGSTSAASCTMNGTVSAIGANHGHVLVVSKDDVTAAVDKTYDITGTANHPHHVTVTAAMFGTLKNNTSVMMTSTTDASHNHPVTVMCA